MLVFDNYYKKINKTLELEDFSQGSILTHIDCLNLLNNSVQCVGSSYGSRLYTFNLGIHLEENKVEVLNLKILYKYYDFETVYVAQLSDYIVIKGESFLLGKSGVVIYQIKGSQHAYKVLIDENFGEEFIPDIIAENGKLSVLIKNNPNIFGIRYIIEQDYSINITNMKKYSEESRISFDSFLPDETVTMPIKMIFDTPEKFEKNILIVKKVKLQTMMMLIVLLVIITYIVEFNLRKEEEEEKAISIQRTLVKGAMMSERYAETDFSRIVETDLGSEMSGERVGRRVRVDLEDKDFEKKNKLFMSLAVGVGN